MTVTDLFESRPGETRITLQAVSGGKTQHVETLLNQEHTLELYREDTLLRRFVCSPGALGELCAGWLLCEGLNARQVEISRDGHRAVAHGLCAVPPMGEALPPVETTAEEMLALFRQASGQYARTHGVHECVLKGRTWQLSRTDIGRHNAMDKALGAAFLAGCDLRGAVLFTSGRINVQTVQKALRCGIGCLMSKAVITEQALSLAREAGLRVLFSVTDSGCITGQE